jgi:hypothetical protein
MVVDVVFAAVQRYVSLYHNLVRLCQWCTSSVCSSLADVRQHQQQQQLVKWPRCSMLVRTMVHVGGWLLRVWSVCSVHRLPLPEHA